MPNSRLLKLAEAARYLRISKKTLYRLKACGRIDFVQFTSGGTILFRQEALDRYVAENTVHADDPRKKTQEAKDFRRRILR